MTFDKKIFIDQIGVEERIARFNTRSIKKASKIQGLRLALQMIDLTTLEGKDTPQKVRQMCYKAQHLADHLQEIPNVAAVCVYPNHVKTAKQALAGSTIKIASVATAFPSGNSSLKIKLQDTRLAIENGADEVDMVISRGSFLEGEYNRVFDEIASIKSACEKQARLKVILETGELGSLENVRKASDIAILAGADFIKTSTGKIQPAATMPVTLVMLDAIKDYYESSGKMVGMKPAGGISTAKSALQYLVMLYETLGEAWMSNEWFRFGASSLANDIIMQLGKEQLGVYYSKDYISID
ncbi:MAG: deoxyribose-phosphate aldolase [Chitinophagaceae bacterium]|nr:MAG: Deoxyribose-phosphate aldolase [Bacteroidetes bacterium OLB11]MCC6447434.1 deoxyribose-phosphate aldolase [Chitinophagaceae bacterium]HMN33602.1 deoxyribose-phosphate aldolase [Chitinophagaceae bacterium]